jgi:hypothetical protein
MEYVTLGKFGDKRLEKVGNLLYGCILEKHCISLRKIAKNRAMEVRFGRFLSNEKVTVEKLKIQRISQTSRLASGRHVLGIQDTTELNYQAHADRVRGLGPVGNGKDHGMFLHPLLVLDAESSACLGFGAIHTWIREWPMESVDKKKTSRDYQKLLIEEKESYRWLSAATNAKHHLADAKMLTIIADRESDIYEEWYRIPDEKTYLLTRACYNRRLGNGLLMSEYVASLDVQCIQLLSVRARDKKRSAHIAKLEIRFGEVEITRSRGCSDKNAPEKIKLRVIDVKELPESVVNNEEPIHWCLLTTHDVETVEDAFQLVTWYSWRWNIEQLFRTLKKQGFKIESSQVENGTGLTKLAIIALGCALQTMQLTLARKDEKQERPLSDVFTEEESGLLNILLTQLEGKTEKQKNPYQKGKLAWASWIIARLGGWKGYASERPPGPITMYDGQQEFASLYRGWRLARDVCIP